MHETNREVTLSQIQHVRGLRIHNACCYAHEWCPVVLVRPSEPPLGLLTAIIFADKVLQQESLIWGWRGFLSESAKQGTGQQPYSGFCFARAILSLSNNE